MTAGEQYERFLHLVRLGRDLHGLGVPAVRTPEPDDDGRGLLLVDLLATAWDHRDGGGAGGAGGSVWFRMAAPTPEESDPPPANAPA